MKYRKKPVVVEAVQFTGRNHDEVRAFCPTARYPILSATGGDDPPITIPTLEGDMVAQAGDWIIRGVRGECYPCKPDIFEMTYEDAEVCAQLHDVLTPGGRIVSFDDRVVEVLIEAYRPTPTSPSRAQEAE